MEDFRKKESTRNLGNKKFLKSNKTTVGSHSSSIDKVEDRISGLKDKIDINEKTEEFVDKRHKSYKWNTKELSNSVKRPNLQIIGIEKGEEVKAKGVIYSPK
jgi:hypothetical protein